MNHGGAMHLRAPGAQPALWFGALALCAGALALAGTPAPRLLVLLLLGPLLEEAIFRAGLHEALLRRWAGLPALWANLVTAIAFGLAHMLVRGELAAGAVVLPALAIGLVYQRGRRLRHCIALHAAMNAAWLLIGLPG